MSALCQVCVVHPFKYRCPTCLTKYCSLPCFKLHKESPCEKPAVLVSEDCQAECPPLTYNFPTVDTVPVEKLQELVNSDEIKSCLYNPHVREIMKSLVEDKKPDVAIENAMKEPIFLELAHACLKIVEPERFQLKSKNDF